MKIRHLALVPLFSALVACGGSSTPEPETPVGEAAGVAEEPAPAMEEEPIEEAAPAEAPAEEAPVEGEAPAAE